MALHVPTILLLFALGNLILAGLATAAFYRRRQPAIDLWIASLVAQAVAWLFFLSRDYLPDLVTTVAAGALLALNLGLLAQALCSHYGIVHRRHWPHWPIPVALVGAALLNDHEALRQVPVSLLYVFQLGFAAWVLFRQRDRWGGLRGLIGGAALLSAAVVLLRAIAALVRPDLVPPIPEPGALQAAILIAVFVSRHGIALGFVLLIEARRHDEISDLATRDPLTGAYNRRGFIELAQRELARARRTEEPLGLLVMDLDLFKRINDTHGHLAGDAALRHFRAIAEGSLRAYDLLGRFGGEEFCVIAPGTSLAAATQLAERLRAAVSESPLILPDGHRIPLSVSVGVAALGPADPEAAFDTLVARADEALLRAKENGRNRVERSASVRLPTLRS